MQYARENKENQSNNEIQQKNQIKQSLCLNLLCNFWLPNFTSAGILLAVHSVPCEISQVSQLVHRNRCVQLPPTSPPSFPNHYVILNLMATQYTCSLNGVYCPHTHQYSLVIIVLTCTFQSTLLCYQATLLPQCHANCSHYINNGWTLSRQCSNSQKQIIKQNAKQIFILLLNPYGKQLFDVLWRNACFILSLLQIHSVLSVSMGDQNKPKGTVHSSEITIKSHS